MKKLTSKSNFKEIVLLSSSRQKGVSLLEIMVVIGIVAVLAGMAAPSFTETIRRYRVSSARDSMSATINFARVEAIRNGAQVVIERLPASGSCTASLVTDSDWGCGWTVYVDRDNKAGQDASEPSIQTVVEPRGVSVTHPGDSVRLVVNRWGQPGTIGDRFIFFPSDQSIAAQSTTTICINAGGRLRNLPMSPVCTNT